MAVGLLTATLISVALSAARAQATATLTTLHSFTGGTDGDSPYAGLVQGRDGNFYGTTSGGGANGYGSVFQITAAGQLNTLYSFTGGTDEEAPETALVQGSDGNFYGTTYGVNVAGGGTIFQITAAGALTTLHQFRFANHREFIRAALIQGGDGNFYGTTLAGGDYAYGMIFQITPAGAFTTFYSFTGGADGGEPQAALVQGTDGNFYGTTSSGGANGDGTIFQITPAGALTPLYSFTGGTDEFAPQAALIQGRDGNLYGTTEEDGVNGFGTVFRMTPAGGLTTLYSFTGGTDGGDPQAALVQGGDGNFYGTTSSGGANGNGTIFQITPTGVFTPLYSFTSEQNGESVPQAALVQGSDGNFYGTTYPGHGTIFKLTVNGIHRTFFDGETALSKGVYFLTLPSGDYFGYYSFLTDPNYIYHFDLGYEYVLDADDGESGVYFYDFASDDFLYTSPTFPFPYLYDFGLQSIIYYYPDPSSPEHYNTDGIRYFYVFSTGQIISK